MPSHFSSVPTANRPPHDSIGQPGIRATGRLISTCFVWHHMARGIAEWTCQCIACQKAKVHTHISPAPSAVPIPERRFSHIHVDLIGPLPPSHGFTYIHFQHYGTGPQEGQKQCHSPQPQSQHVPRHFALHGYAGLEFHTPSHLTVTINLLMQCLYLCRLMHCLCICSVFPAWCVLV